MKHKCRIMSSFPTCNKATVPFQQGAHQQEDVVRREAHQEDQDGAAHQLPDAALLVRLRASAAAHSAQHTQVADLHT